MDVINLSLGEPEIEPSRDIVVAALDTPPTRAWCRWSRPGTTSTSGPRLHRLARAPRQGDHRGRLDDGDDGPADMIAGFSSSGPTPISLQIKPDVTAPGVDILSSFPGRVVWAELERDEHGGTTRRGRGCAAQASAIRRGRSRRSSRRSTRRATPSRPVGSTGEGHVAARGRRADQSRPRRQATHLHRPDRLSFGLVQRGGTASRQLALADAGGGPAPWAASVAPQATPAGVTLALVDAGRCRWGAARRHAHRRPRDAAEGDARASSYSHAAPTCGRDSVLVPRRGAEAAENAPRSALRARALRRQHRREAVARLELPLSGGRPLVNCGPACDLRGLSRCSGSTVDQKVANFGAVVVSRADRCPRLAAARRSPATRTGSSATPGSPVEPQPVRRRSAGSVPVGRRGLPAPRHVRLRLRHARRRRSRASSCSASG